MNTVTASFNKTVRQMTEMSAKKSVRKSSAKYASKDEAWWANNIISVDFWGAKEQIRSSV